MRRPARPEGRTVTITCVRCGAEQTFGPEPGTLAITCHCGGVVWKVKH